MVGRKQVLENSIERLYEVFASYTAAGFHYCDCGCTEEAEIKHLLSTPLRELGGEALFHFNLSALYTQGDLEHYKHFLPRIFEVYSCLVKDDNLSAWDLLTKLDYAEWQTWPTTEVEAIRRFWLTNWSLAVNEPQLPNLVKEELDSYAAVLGLPNLLMEWKVTSEAKAIDEFVDFFYFNGNAILADSFKVNKVGISKPVMEWIRQERIVDAVEKRYFELVETDPVTAAEFAAVYGMLEVVSLGGASI